MDGSFSMSTLWSTSAGDHQLNRLNIMVSAQLAGQLENYQSAQAMAINAKGKSNSGRRA